MTPRDLGPGAALALSMFSVLPVRGPRPGPDGRGPGPGVATTALVLAPAVGALLGVLAGGLARVLTLAGAAPLLAGLLAVAAVAAGTRGMHLDGLADLADGLGCYGPPERMLAVMRDPSTGAFAVITLVLVLGVQAVALGRVTVVGAVVALALGRATFGWCARRGVPAASAGGLGATVAGTAPAWLAPVWVAVLAVPAALAVPQRWWQGPVAVLVAAGVAAALAGHARRRLGGVSGDVFGGVCEVATTVCLVGLSLG